MPGEGEGGCGVVNVKHFEEFHTARFLNYPWSFFNIINKMVKHNETNTECSRELSILSLPG